MSKYIPLTKGKFAIVDDKDFEWLNQWKWHIVSGYAARSTTKSYKRIHFYLHRIVMEVEKDKWIDHINGDKLDNRKSNLRICNSTTNTYNKKILKSNTSGYKGVHRHQGKWRAQISFNNKVYHIGMYDTLHEAARAYNEAANKYYGKYANLNKL